MPSTTLESRYPKLADPDTYECWQDQIQHPDLDRRICDYCAKFHWNNPYIINPVCPKCHRTH